MSHSMLLHNQLLLIPERISMGIEYLQMRRGLRWYRKVDTERLSMGNPAWCIVAQLDGSFCDSALNEGHEANVKRGLAVSPALNWSSRTEYLTALTRHWCQTISTLKRTSW